MGGKWLFQVQHFQIFKRRLLEVSFFLLAHQIFTFALIQMFCRNVRIAAYSLRKSHKMKHELVQYEVIPPVFPHGSFLIPVVCSFLIPVHMWLHVLCIVPMSMCILRDLALLLGSEPCGVGQYLLAQPNAKPANPLHVLLCHKMPFIQNCILTLRRHFIHS